MMPVPVIEKYFPEISARQHAQFAQMQALYSYWNERINVISRKDIDELYVRHVLHSLAIAKNFNFPDNCNILDVGTGGGFPGIPLAIMFPQVHFTLSDSIGKKINVVNQIARELGLNNITALHVRSENINNNFHFVVSRAVADFSEIVKWTAKKLDKKNVAPFKNGIICLKGGDLSEELKNYPNAAIIELSRIFDEEFFETKKIVYAAFS